MSEVASTMPVCPLVTPPDLTTFARLDVLGLRVTGQQVWPDKAILFCSLTSPDAGCPDCGRPGVVHDHVVRRFTPPTCGPESDLAACRRARLPLCRLPPVVAS